MRARAMAAELWRRHDLSAPVDLRAVVDDLDLEVVTLPFAGRVKEVIVDGTIGVQPDLPRPWFRWYVAHAVGHHLMHVGAGFYLQSWQRVNHAKAERQAEEFAAWLTGGPEGWRGQASELGIPPEKLLLVRHLCGPDQVGTGQDPRAAWFAIE